MEEHLLHLDEKVDATIKQTMMKYCANMWTGLTDQDSFGVGFCK
jgi:hypothetical protein